MPLSRANPPLMGRRGGPVTRRAWPRARMILGNAGKGTYERRVLKLDPIAYWPLWEESGTVAECLVDSAMNGAYARDVSVMGTGDGIGDGRTAPEFDGTNDYINIQSAALAAAINGDAGTALIWSRVNSAANWSDALSHHPFYLVDATDWQEFVYASIGTASAYMRWMYGAGGTVSSVGNVATGSPTDFFLHGLSWDKSADEMKAFFDGAKYGATQTGLGTWAGAITQAFIGSNSAVPTNPWHGRQAHMMLFDYAVPEAEIDKLSVV